MNREKLAKYILETYGTKPDFPWKDETDYAVFRHQTNRKWYALIMRIPEDRLGRDGRAPIDVVNLKCETALIGSMLSEPGIYPAYHMNKDHWITAALGGSAVDDTILMLLDLSFGLTAPRMRRGKRAADMQDEK